MARIKKLLVVHSHGTSSYLFIKLFTFKACLSRHLLVFLIYGDAIVPLRATVSVTEFKKSWHYKQ